MTVNSSKRGLSYVLGESSAHENHILPINAMQYANNTLYTAGRDGTVKMWRSEYEQAELDLDHLHDEDEYLEDLDERILKLETNISSMPVPSYENHKRKVSGQTGPTDPRSTGFQDKARNSIETSRNSVFGEPTHDASSFAAFSSHSLHFDWVNDIKLIGNSHLASCSSDLSIKLTNLQDSTTTQLPNVHTDYINKLSYAGGELISAGLDERIVLWDLARLTPTQELSNASSSTLPNSVYSLANNSNGNLIATGGPNNTINLFDKRSQYVMRKLIGHQDNIRCLLMDTEGFILSGSSDTSVKLWDPRMFKVCNSFYIHDFPVYSLCSASDSGFSTFYSGDKGGTIVKTDLHFVDHQNDDNLGVSTIVAQSDSPILSLCDTHKGSIFSSNYQGLHKYLLPDTSQLAKYQYFKSVHYSHELEIQEGGDSSSTLNQTDDLNSGFYDLVSHLSVETTQDVISLNDEFASDSEESVCDQEEYKSMFLNVNGGPSREFINTYKDSEEEESVPISKGLLNETPVEILLNPISASRITLVPYNLRPSFTTPITAKSIISKRLLNNKRHMLVLYINGDITLWDILTCTQLKSFKPMAPGTDLDARAKELDAIFSKLQTDDTLNSWCEIEIKAGKLLVSIKETSFLNVEVYYDDLLSSYPVVKSGDYDGDDRFYLGVVFLDSLFAEYYKFELEFDAALRQEVIVRSKKPELDEPNLKRLFGRKTSKSVSQQSSPALSRTTTNSEFAEFMRTTEENLIAAGHDNTIMKLLAGNKRIYFERQRVKSKDDISLLTMHEDMRPPLTQFPLDLQVTLFEYSPDLGNYRDLFSFQLSDLKNLQQDPQLVYNLRTQLPRWIGMPMLYNRIPPKESPRITFELSEYNYQNLDPNVKIQGKSGKKIKKLPVVDSAIKLTSHNMLRVSKILGYLIDKFDSKTSEMRAKTPVVDWLVLECRGTELPPTMTLQTIKTRVWKSNTDIELTFRRRFDR